MAARYLVAGLLVGLASAALDKPALHPNLDYCNQGLLDNLHPTHSTHDQWGAGWIPQDCANMASDAGLDPRDIRAWNVHYTDCGDAWVLCRHISAPNPIIDVIDLFGRLPVATRQWVRHVIALPDPAGGHAYNSNGNIALFSNLQSSMNVFVHEAGHSIDLLGAYPDKPLSSSQTWLNNYNHDSAVPDPYAQTNQVENVAQNTVVSMFDRNVPGGFGSIESGWNRIFHQYATLQSEADNGGYLLRPGGTCTQRLANSAPVQVGTRKRTTHFSQAPHVQLSSNVATIAPKEFDTRKLDCAYNTPATHRH